MTYNVKRLYKEGSQLYAIVAVPEGKDWCKGCALNKRQDCGMSCKELGGKLRKVEAGDYVKCTDGNIYVILFHNGVETLHLLKPNCRWR